MDDPAKTDWIAAVVVRLGEANRAGATLHVRAGRPSLTHESRRSRVALSARGDAAAGIPSRRTGLSCRPTPRLAEDDYSSRSRVMNWSEIETGWPVMKALLASYWRELSDDDLALIDGRRDQLA